MKAYLRSGAEPLFETVFYPNDRTGYGALCLADSIPPVPLSGV